MQQRIRWVGAGLLSAAIASGCASPGASGGETAGEPSQPRSGAVATTRAPERTVTPTDPVVEASTPLAYIEPTTDRHEAAAPEWSPPWYREGLSKHNGQQVACAVASAEDLLTARRDAVAAATEVFRTHDDRAPTVSLTATRQLDDGRFRVWVRIAGEG